MLLMRNIRSIVTQKEVRREEEGQYGEGLLRANRARMAVHRFGGEDDGGSVS